MRLWWGPSDEDAAIFASIDELMERLKELDQTSNARPIMVDVFADVGSVVSVGVGAGVSVLTHMNADRNPPYLTSRSGDPARGETLWFDYGGSETEFLPEALLAKDAAFSLVRDFLERGDTSSVQWKEE